jgi:competence protein ComEC
MFLTALAFLAGHCAVHALPVLPTTRWLWLVAAAASLFALLRVRWCLALTVGVCWAWSHAAWRIADALPAQAEPTDAEVSGYVASTVDTDPAVRFAFDVQSAVPALPKRIEITWYDTAQRPAPGELWQLRVRVRPPRGFANPGGNDYAAQLFRGGLGATGYVRTTARDAPRNVRLAKASWRYPILRARASLADKLALALPNSPMLGIVQGLAVGDTQRIPSEQWQVFANTGTTHLMAISGLHIGMVAALLAWLAGRLARRLPLQLYNIAIVDVQALAGMTAAFGYSALAGFSVPTQRTLVMLLVYFGTRVLRRNIGATQGLALALVGVLLIDPFAPLAPGFWLSFGAVGTIFLASAGQLARPGALAEYWRLQAAISVGLLPFLIGSFGSVSLISPLVNLLAIPLFTFVIVPLVLTGCLLLLLPMPLGAWLVQSAAWLLEKTWPALQWASDLPQASWHLPQLPWWAAALLIAGCAVAIAPGVAVTRFAGVLLCLPALVWSPTRPAAGEFSLAVLDVGQGLAVVVVTHSHVMVYDTGASFRSGRDTGQLVVLPYLYSRGIRALDMLVLSHGDNDHVGGARSVQAGLQTRFVLAGPSVAQRDLPLPPASEVCKRSQRWQWDQVRFEVLHPNRTAQGDNDSSCVLLISGVGGSALLLGDVERAAEAELVTARLLPRTDIVVVPHHGSRTSSAPELVTATSPRFALVSAGYGNRWGFPKPDIVARWNDAGANVLNTADSGAIEFTVTRQGVGPAREYRREHRAYWHE